MSIVTVSGKGQVVIPVAIRRGLGIKAGTELEFELDGPEIRVSLRHALPSANIEDGYGMLRAKPSGKPRKLAEFDPADAMRKQRTK